MNSGSRAAALGLHHRSPRAQERIRKNTCAGTHAPQAGRRRGAVAGPHREGVEALLLELVNVGLAGGELGRLEALQQRQPQGHRGRIRGGRQARLGGVPRPGQLDHLHLGEPGREPVGKGHALEHEHLGRGLVRVHRHLGGEGVCLGLALAVHGLHGRVLHPALCLRGHRGVHLGAGRQEHPRGHHRQLRLPGPVVVVVSVPLRPAHGVARGRGRERRWLGPPTARVKGRVQRRVVRPRLHDHCSGRHLSCSRCSSACSSRVQ